MRGAVAATLVFAVMLVGGAGAAPTGDPPSPYHCWLEKELAQLYEEVSPAIVSVVSFRLQVRTGGAQTGVSYVLHRLVASGVVVGAHGCVVVPARVAQPGDSIVVHFPTGSRMVARYKGTDPATNIAVLNLAGEGPFPYLEPPESDEIVLPEWVAAVAYGRWRGPHPGWPSLTLSQKASIERWETRFGDHTGELWRLHAPISPGNQGGALVSLSGNWVGLISGAIWGAEGPSYAGGRGTARRSNPGNEEGVIVPAAVVARAIREIESGKRASSGFLGVRTEPAGQPAAAGSTTSRGIIVSEVLPESPAARYGMLPGDRILAFDGNPVNSVSQLTRLVQGARPGDDVVLRIGRGQTELELAVCLGDSNAAELFFNIRRENLNERQSLERELQRLRIQEEKIKRSLNQMGSLSDRSSGS